MSSSPSSPSSQSHSEAGSFLVSTPDGSSDKSSEKSSDKSSDKSNEVFPGELASPVDYPFVPPAREEAPMGGAGEGAARASRETDETKPEEKERSILPLAPLSSEWTRVAIHPKALYPVFHMFVELLNRNFFLTSRKLLVTSWCLYVQKIGDALFYREHFKSFDSSALALSKYIVSVSSLELGKGAHSRILLNKKINLINEKEVIRRKKILFQDGSLDHELYFFQVIDALREMILVASLYGREGEVYRYAFDPLSQGRKGRVRMTLPVLSGDSFEAGTVNFMDWCFAFGEACSQTAALHRLGAAHLDIKPSNMLWDSKDKQCALIDFGAAFFEPEFASNKNIPRTTSWYRPLDSFRAKGGDEKHGYSTDVYSLGCTFLQKAGFRLSRLFRDDTLIQGGEGQFKQGLTQFLSGFFKPTVMDPVMALLPESLRVSESEVVVFLLKSMVAVESDSRLPHVYLGEVGEYFKNLSSYLKQSIRRNLGDLTIVLPDFKGLSREILEYQSMLEAFSGTPKATSTVFFDTVESSGATASAGAGAPAVDSGI